MSDITIRKSASILGKIKVPGDKSISHRALMFSSLAEGVSNIKGLSLAQDVMNTKKCMKALGITIEKKKDIHIVHGNGTDGLKAPAKVLDAGNSGTTIRLLSGILAAQNFTATITGDESLRQRPMRRIMEPLENMGARITAENHRAPITILGGPLKAIDFASSVASAQVKSCVLLAGLFAKGLTRVTEPALSRDHTERMLKEFGVRISYNNGMTGLFGPASLKAVDLDIPGDVSAAAFFLIAACLLPNSKIEIENVGTNPTRTGFLDALAAMGASIFSMETAEINNEPRATLSAKTSALKATTFSGTLIPRIIDEVPILAIAATQANGTTIIKDAGELRVKESDRITTVTENLKKMGANIRENKDGMTIIGPSKLKGAVINSYGDHRIAMSFAVAGMLAEGETTIKNVDCVNTSFPDFFSLLESVKHD